MKDRARSLIPAKLLAAQCTLRGGGDHLLDDAVTPVIYYPDQDVVTKRVAHKTLVDPFSFEVTFEDSDGSSDDEKEDANDYNSPTSVIPVRLFQDDNSSIKVVTSSATGDSSKQKSNTVVFDEVVKFDCPIFTQDFKFNEDDTSIELSEAIKSINAKSVKEEATFILESVRNRKKTQGELWQDPILSWDGFTRSSSFTKCVEWEDPKSDDAA